MVMLSAFLVTLPDLAHAVNTPMGAVMCVVTAWFTGNTGKGLATIAITVIGIGALLGKVSWGMAIIVGTGVAIIFGAAGIVNAMGGPVSIQSNCSTLTS
jgi:type IV secretory pathway VirB2 component (pilin)